MASRFECAHERWARQRHERRDRGEMRMGSTPACLWCAGETGQKMAHKVALSMAVAAEREACAKLIEDFFATANTPELRCNAALLVEAIRARGGK